MRTRGVRVGGLRADVEDLLEQFVDAHAVDGACELHSHADLAKARVLEVFALDRLAAAGHGGQVLDDVDVPAVLLRDLAELRHVEAAGEHGVDVARLVCAPAPTAKCSIGLTRGRIRAVPGLLVSVLQGEAGSYRVPGAMRTNDFVANPDIDSSPDLERTSRHWRLWTPVSG